nr:MAG TPA: hypothetical protein [Caudoviricetes sp.]
MVAIPRTMEAIPKIKVIPVLSTFLTLLSLNLKLIHLQPHRNIQPKF